MELRDAHPRGSPPEVEAMCLTQRVGPDAEAAVVCHR